MFECAESMSGHRGSMSRSAVIPQEILVQFLYSENGETMVRLKQVWEGSQAVDGVFFIGRTKACQALWAG